MKRLCNIFIKILFVFVFLLISNNIVKAAGNIATFASDAKCKIKALAGTYCANSNPSIVAIKRSDIPPTVDNTEEKNIISSSDSSLPIYAWYENEIIYYYTEAEHLALTGDCARFLSGFRRLKEIDLSSWNTSSVTNMEGMFEYCESLTTLDLSNFDTSRVTYMSDMFYGCSSLQYLNLSSFDISKVKSLYSMFYNNSNLEMIEVSEKWKSSAIVSNDMFKGCTKLVGMNGTSFDETKIDETYARIDTETTKGYLWNVDRFLVYWAVDGDGCSENTDGNCKLTLSSKNIEGEHFDSGSSYYAPWKKYNSYIDEIQIGGENDILSPYIIDNWFINLKVKEIDLTYLDTSRLVSMNSMFKGCSNLETLDLSNFNTSNVTDMSEMFSGCKNLEIIVVPNNWKNASLSDDMFKSCDKLVGMGGSYFWNYMPNHIYWAVDGNNCNNDLSSCKLIISNNEISGNHFDNGNLFYVGRWNQYKSIREVQIGGENDIISTLYMKGWFKNLSNLKTLDLQYLDTSNMTDMSYLFEGLINITGIDLSNFNTSNVTNMQGLFYGLTKLSNIDLSQLDTSKVTNMRYLFSGCSSLTNIDLSHLDTSKVEDMSYMFSSSGLISVDVSVLDTTRLNYIYGMFSDCYNLTSINFDDFDTSKVTNMSSLFKNCINLNSIDLSKFDTSRVTYMSDMFNGCISLTNLDVRSFNTSNVTNMNDMFNNCRSIKTLDLSHFRIKTNNGSISVSSHGMFSGTDKLKTIYISNSTQDDLFRRTTEPHTYLQYISLNLKIENVNGNDLEISWDKVETTKYNIFRSEKKNSGFKKISSQTNNVYVDRNLKYGKTYYYRVEYCDDFCYVNSHKVFSKKVVPSKVDLKISSASTNNIKLSWGKINVTGYEIYRSTDKKKWAKVTIIKKGSITSYNDKKLKASKKYYYKVRAYKTVSGKKIYGLYSGIVITKTAPKKPTLKVTLKDYNAMNVEMGETKGATLYRLEKSLDGVNYKLIEEYPASGKVVSDEQEIGKTYYFRLKACNSDNRCSGWVKAELKQTTKTPGFSLKTSSKKVTITMSKVNGATGYQIYRATSKKGKYSKIKEFSSEVELLEYINKTKKKKTYYFKVRSFALNESGKRVYSPYSKIKSIRSK